MKELKIENFRSILDVKIKLDYYLTTFIGANESGKTNVLKALACINDREIEDNDFCTYSDLFDKLKRNVIQKEEINIVEVLFQLENDDQAKLQNIHPKLGDVTTLKFSKRFSNSLYVNPPKNVVLSELAKEKKKDEIDTIINDINEDLNSFYKEFGAHLINPDPSQDLEQMFSEIIDKITKKLEIDEYNLDDEYNRIRLFSPKDVTPTRTRPKPPRVWSSRFNDLINEIITQVTKIQQLQDQTNYLIKDIFTILPNVEFLSFDELQDRYNYDEFMEKSDQFPTLKKLIEFTGLDVGSLKVSNINEVKQDLDYASNIITDRFNEFWEQDDIKFHIDVINNEIAVSITDNLIRISQPMSMRSQGLNGVVSLFINVMSIPKHSIILLDDPGIHLHASGQKDILRMLEKLSEDRQIVLTTHSPFLINRNKLERIRIVTKNEEHGTTISEKFHISDYDALEPIRASIGMTLSDSLFTTEKNLLVEGQSDYFILESLSRLSKEKNLDYIDTSISIFPVNGADKMPYYTTFLLKDKSDFVVLLDNDDKGRTISKRLIDKFNVDEHDVITLDMVLDNDGKDIIMEDLIDIDFYLKSLNQAYNDIFSKKGLKPIEIKDLKEESFKGILKLFGDERGDLDKILVSRELSYIIQSKADLPNDETIENFSNLFKTINEKIIRE